jgi:2-polyprenyl-3-methyl-5-hydroxy-6-metoxy-1,4-benzoquinol methylase
MAVQDRYLHYLGDQRQFFNELITEDWETYKSDDWNYTRSFEVKQLFDRVQPASILDIGCGCGFHDKVMADYAFVEMVDAIDYSEQSILRAEATYPHLKVRRIVADFTTHYPERKYDLVVSFQVLEHISNPDEYMNFCVKSCAPQGFVAIVTPNRLRLENRLRRLEGQSPVLIDVMHYREYSLKELKAIGKKFGLKTYASFGFGFPNYGLPGLKKLSIRQLTKLGCYFPLLANGIGIIWRNPATRRR